MNPATPESGPYHLFIRLLEDMFICERSAVQWDQYASAIVAKSSKGFRGPEFLSISPARSATTWLFQQLRRNAAVYLPEVKETNFLINGWLDGPYDRFFDGWQPHQSTGDISPNYALLPRHAVREIHRAFPKMRLICILRPPIERVWSQMLFELTRKGGRFQMAPQDISDLSEQQLLTLAAYFSSLNRYDAILQRWLEFYPPQQLHVDFFHRVASSPDALLSRLVRFLKVPDRGSAFTGKVNALEYDLVTMPQSVHAFLREFYAPQLRTLDLLLRDRFGLGIPESWHTTTTGDSRSFKSVEIGIGKPSPEFWRVMPKMEERFDEDVLERLMAWMCENRHQAHGPKLLSSHSAHNLVAFEGKIYALPYELGVWDKWHKEDPASVPGVLVGPSIQAVVTMLDREAQKRRSANSLTETE
jgi:hypothetical protein